MVPRDDALGALRRCLRSGLTGADRAAQVVRDALAGHVYVVRRTLERVRKFGADVGQLLARVLGLLAQDVHLLVENRELFGEFFAELASHLAQLAHPAAEGAHGEWQSLRA